MIRVIYRRIPTIGYSWEKWEKEMAEIVDQVTTEVNEHEEQGWTVINAFANNQIFGIIVTKKIIVTK